MTAPHDPIPLSPRRQHIVDGEHIVLEWEPSDGAMSYRVQIARDPDFYDTVIDEDVPTGTLSLRVRQPLPTDDDTFYWRVLARGPERWSEGDRIESFISGRPQQVDQFATPDESEPLGPVGALLSQTSLMALAEALPGDQPEIDAELGEAHPESIEAAEVLTIHIGMIIAAVVLVGAILVALVAAC